MADRTVIDYHTSTPAIPPMPMLDARDPTFKQQYPNGCHTYDARGRRIPFVQVSNPETGEVVRFVPTADGTSIRYAIGGDPWRRHGFWPAPLRAVPLP